MNKDKLPKSFYQRSSLEVAKDLIGKRFFFNGISGIITETECYSGSDDPASHAFKGRTLRSSIMFGQAGISYVYLIYGMYHCLNIVTDVEGTPGAVLLRGLKVDDLHLDGPGKLCRFLNITKEHNGLDLSLLDDFYCSDGQALEYKATPRIGIKVGQDKLWRFVSAIYN